MSNFLLILAELSIAAAIFYGIYHLSMKVFKKRITKQCRYILCLLVVFRMLIPFGMNIEIPWDSVGEKIFGPAPEKAADVVTFKENVPENTYEETFLGVRIENDARENSYEALADEPIIGTPQENKEDLFTAGVVSRNTVGSQEISMHAAVEDQSKLSSIFGRWETLVFSLWLLGAIVSFIYYEAGYLRWKRMILSGCRPAELEDDELLEQMYPNGYVDVLQSDQVSTPLLCGAICPYLILPEGGFVKNGRQSTLEHIFRHEMYHVKRQDLIWKHFAILAQSVHWFNPFLHSICKELSRCCELSCDEAVTKEMEMQDVRAYGETILTLASGTFAKAPIPVNGFCREKEELMERLDGIMNKRKMSGRVLALSLALVLIMSGCGTMLAPDQSVLADTMGEVIAEVEETVAGEEVTEAVKESLAGEQTEAAENEESAIAEETEAAEEKHPLLLSDVLRETKAKAGGDGKTQYDAFDTMYIMAAGQETKLYVKDMDNILNPSETPNYDINKFVELAAHALDHLYELSGYRSDHWNVVWSTSYGYSLDFGLSDFVKCEEFYWINYANAYSEAILGEEARGNSISNIGFTFSESRDYSPISWEDMKKPDNLQSMSEEEAAQWYYENYLVYDAAEADTVLLTDANLGGKASEAEIYTVDGEAFYIHLMDDKMFSSMYGPYPERSVSHWRNIPSGLEDTFEDPIS